MSATIRCYFGHPTQWPDGQAQLPCGCVLRTATDAALLHEFMRIPSRAEIEALCAEVEARLPERVQ